MLIAIFNPCFSLTFTVLQKEIISDCSNTHIQSKQVHSGRLQACLIAVYTNFVIKKLIQADNLLLFSIFLNKKYDQPSVVSFFLLIF
jgi:hypothetical protein